MPELPEVENIAQGLRQEIVGQTIQSLSLKKPVILRGPYRRRFRQAARTLTNAKITAVTRRGKRLIITTDKDLALIAQLGMTGRFSLTTPAAPREKHTHFIINFNNNLQLRFIDPRRFGRLCFLDHLDPNNPDPAMEAAGFGKMGPEPQTITAKQFSKILTAKRPLKSLLLDQSRIAGLGNIYVDESLFAAQLHPLTLACDINVDQAKKLRAAIRTILKKSINHGGTTFSDFRNAYGDAGNFRKKLKVYQRNYLPCPKCKTPIKSIRIVGRSSHFCPNCQIKKK